MTGIMEVLLCGILTVSLPGLLSNFGFGLTRVCFERKNVYIIGTDIKAFNQWKYTSPFFTNIIFTLKLLAL